MIRALSVLAALCVAGCGGAEEAGAPYPELRLAAAERAGLDPSLLRRADATFAATPGLRSVLVMRHAETVFERYYGGVGVNSEQDVFSITKSVVSALVGIEVARGRLRLDERLVHALPQQLEPGADPRIHAITLRDLLTMTAGYRRSSVVSTGDVIRTLVNRPLASDPGTTFSYDDGSAHLLSAVLTKASGLPAEELARRALFAPLGAHLGRWISDGQGNSLGSTGLFLRPRDLLKLGELYLRRGRWDGRRIIPASWVRESTTTQVTIRGGYAYGYLWWVNTGPHGGFLAQGFAGQALAVHPRLDLVVAMTGSGGFDHREVLGTVLRAVVR
jgi:CubicO group peptidase (beta-lactamase class C family)